MITMKGKRTKRQRTQSPCSFSLASSHLLNEEDGGRFESANDAKMEPSPSSSSRYTDSCTEEEEDMANCLILLAHGESVARESRMELAANNHRNADIRKTSKRFLETSSVGDGKVGYYVYACKTCNRTFSSFQALGGHRASHKKPKPNYIEEVNQIDNNILETDTEDERFKNNNSQFPLQLSYDNKELHGNVQQNATTNQKIKGNNKVHECGICGAEFNSGQALGGHMRRHRGAMGSTNMGLSLSLLATESDKDEDKSKTSRKVLSLELDLNLPAQEEDNLEFRSDFASKQHQEQPQQQQDQQQQSLVVSSPALVNCQH